MKLFSKVRAATRLLDMYEQTCGASAYNPIASLHTVNYTG